MLQGLTKQRISLLYKLMLEQFPSVEISHFLFNTQQIDFLSDNPWLAMGMQDSLGSQDMINSALVVRGVSFRKLHRALILQPIPFTLQAIKLLHCPLTTSKQS